MAQLTDRVDNQNIINIAKSQFETQQRSKLPTVIVKLASQGKIYPSTHVLRSGQLEMRHMTAYDEDILTNTSYIRENVVFDRLLEAIICTDVNVSEIATVDKDGLIIQARILAYGSDYPVIVVDPKTKESLDRNVNLNALTNRPFDLESDELGEFSYKISDTQSIKFTWPLTDTTTGKVSDELKLAIREVNGKRDAATIDQFIRYEFLSIDAKKFRKYMYDNMPGLDFNYEFESDDKGTFTALFRVGTDLFWF